MKTEDEKEAVKIMIEACKDIEYLEDAMLAGYRALLGYRGLHIPKSDAWIPWNEDSRRGPSHLNRDALVSVRLRDSHMPVAAKPVGSWDWSQDGRSWDIIAYRVAS